MWRSQSTHERADSEFLEAFVQRVRSDAHFVQHADAVLAAASASEPLIADCLQTPQTPPHHNEGPYVHDHVRLMLACLQAVVEGSVHLIDIEEFRALKGYEGEIDELEETMRENAALFEIFCLCHDAAKWATLSFSAPPGSLGAENGFVADRSMTWEDIGISERAKLRERFLALYHSFADEVRESDGRILEASFYGTYQIRAHYYGHDRAVHSHAYRGLLRRLCDAHGLPSRDQELLEDVIAHHLEPGADFKTRNPARVQRYVSLAAARGYDADDFLDILQAGVFLDMVCGSEPHDVSVLLNFLRSEHDYAPWKRALKEQRREEERKRERQRAFRLSGLDGVALMELLRMDPGPQFGRALRVIQEAIAEGKPLPRFNASVDQELARRTAAFYEAAFDKETD